MAISLNGLTRKELLKLEKQVQAQLVKLETQDKKRALAAVEKAVSAKGFTLGDVIVTKQPTQKRKAKAAKTNSASTPKYAHPENAAVTWTGKGRQPAWFKEAVSAGKSADDLLIK